MGLDIMRYKLTSRKVKNGGEFTICKEGEEQSSDLYKAIVAKGLGKWIHKKVDTYYDVKKYIVEHCPEGYRSYGWCYNGDGGYVTFGPDNGGGEFMNVPMKELPTFEQTNLVINHGPELSYQRKGMWGFQDYLIDEAFGIGKDMMQKVYDNSEFDEGYEGYNPKEHFYKHFVKPVDDKTIVFFSW